jgi:GT2 family glycosyltransferase
MTTLPQVSLLIRTRDRKDLLTETLASVKAQTWPALEVIIVNDGGEDFSSHVVSAESPVVRWINNSGDHGRSHAANLALAQATGQYCLFLDDDDLIDPGHIETLVRALTDQQEYRLAYSAIRTMTSGVEETEPSFAYPYDPVRLMIENFIPIHAVLFERCLLDEGFRFDPAFDRFEDWDFWLQIAQTHSFLYVDQCTGIYRVNPTSGFGAKDGTGEDIDTHRLALYRKWLGRWSPEQLLRLFDRGREYPRIQVLENTVTGLNNDITQKLAFIQQLNARVDDRDQKVLVQQKQIADTEKQLHVAVHDLHQSEKQLHVAVHDLHQSENELRGKRKQVQTLTDELQVIYNSKSWKLTRPLRGITKVRYFLRTEGVGGLLSRVRLKLAARFQRVKKIKAKSPVSDRYTALDFAVPDQPLVSIVIPVYNKYQYTFHCLKSIHDHGSRLPFEIIVVNDCSSDKTLDMLNGIKGITIINNEKNLGFIRSCNAGGEAARGEYLVLLNNDTEVRPGWLEALHQTFTDFPDAGMVGARLVFANGMLQEAGGIVWRDGSAWNYGRGGDPNTPEYSYCRQVDYCSGACLMLPLADYQGYGGFDTLYLPAYYEDTDLAFKVRQAGKKVYYQPGATIIHFEGITSGTDTGSGIKQYQQINHGKFFERWEESLKAHRPNARLPHLEKERHIEKRILVVDARVLMPDHDSGSLRMFNILKILQRIGYKVTFVPANLQYHEKYTPMMQSLGFECQYVPYVQSVSKYLEDYGQQFDAVILSRADYAERFIDDVRAFCPQAKVLFDTVDLHFLREQREAELNGNTLLAESAAMRKTQELSIARKADVTLVVSPVELELFREEAPDVTVNLLSNIHQSYQTGKPFGERQDILFIGNFEHPPNTDAMIWFLDEVFPLVQDGNSDITLKIVGGHVPQQLQALASKHVDITGFVDDIQPLFDNIRLSIAPLRYGAGVKGKINSSMSYGVPMVVSTIAAEGMNLIHGEDILIADAPEDMAREILRLYDDEGLWQALSESGKRNIEQHFSFAVAEAQLRDVLA